MIVNILRFTFRDGVDDETRATVLNRMRLTAGVESVEFATVGKDLGDPAEGFTHAYCVALRDLAALERYFYDPVHLAGDFEILPYLQRLHPVRLSDESDPTLGNAIHDLFMQKVNRFPEWGRLLAAIPDAAVQPNHRN